MIVRGLTVRRTSEEASVGIFVILYKDTMLLETGQLPLVSASLVSVSDEDHTQSKLCFFADGAKMRSAVKRKEA